MADAAAPEPRVRNLFATPVLVEPWPEARTLNSQLRQSIVERSATDPGVNKSNLLGWQSDLDLHEWGGEAARRLRDHVIQRCASVTHDLRAGERNIRWNAEMWANVSGRGASNQVHAHPGSYWSAVYYVDDGYARSPDKALAGELMFVDPRYPMLRMSTPDLRYRRPDGSRDNQEVWMRPQAGLIVIFPSWLQHAVRPYEGEGKRISVAINLIAREVHSSGRAADG